MKIVTVTSLCIGLFLFQYSHADDILSGITLQETLKNTGQSEPGNVLNGNYNSPTIDLYTTSETSVVSVFFDVENNRNKWRFGFKVPAQKGEDTTLASLDGLAKYNTVTVGYQWSFYPAVSVATSHRDCIDLKNKIEKTSLSYQEGCSLTQLMSTTSSSKYSNELLDMFANRWKGGIWSFALDSELGTKSFSYFADTLSTTKSKENKEAWSLKASLNWFNAIDRAVTIQYRRESKYVDADTATFCADLNIPCVSGPIGVPVKQDGDILMLQYRQVFNQEKNQAFTIKIEHDFEEDNTKVEVPVYLFISRTEGYGGGVAFGWNESDPGINVGIFIGKSFDI